MNYAIFVREQIKCAVKQIRNDYVSLQRVAHGNPEIFQLSSGRTPEKKLPMDEINTHFTYIRGIIYGCLISDTLSYNQYSLMWRYINRVEYNMLQYYWFN